MTMMRPNWQRLVDFIKTGLKKYPKKYLLLGLLLPLLWLLCFLFAWGVYIAIFLTLGYILFVVGLIIWKLYGVRWLKQRINPIQHVALQRNILRAIQILKHSELGATHYGKAAIQALPWFLLVGDESAGKSSLLQHSGLSFPYDNNLDDNICNWWFTNEGVILDTAGKYFISTDTIKDEWDAWLRLLCKSRGRQPINGIVVVISLAKILDQDQKQLHSYGTYLRQYLNNIYKVIGFVVPITIVVTKIDIIEGFYEFFGSLSPQQKKQCLGVPIGDSVTSELNVLHEQLTKFIIPTLIGEQDVAKKFAIYDFPHLLHRNLDKLAEVLRILKQVNPYQESPEINNIFFTSSKAASASFFITNVFKKHLFASQPKLSKTRAMQTQYGFMKLGHMLGYIGAVFVALLLYSAALTRNISLLRSSQAVTDQLISNGSVNSLIAAYRLYHTIDNETAVSWYLHLGLYRGSKIKDPLQEILAYKAEQQFLQPMQRYLSTLLQHYNHVWSNLGPQQQGEIRGKYYVALKAYLLLHYPERIDLQQDVAIFSNYWSRMLTKGEQLNLYERYVDTRSYNGLVKFCLQHISGSEINNELVIKARQNLYLTNNSDNLYAELKIIASSQLEPLNIDNLITNNNHQLINQHYISGYYSKKNWHGFIKPLLMRVANAFYDEDWVLDTPIIQLGDPDSNEANPDTTVTQQEKQQLIQQLESRYNIDTYHAWLEFLHSTRIRPFISCDDAISSLKGFVTKTGPLLQLLKVVFNNLNLSQLKLSEFKNYSDALQNIRASLEALQAKPDVALAAQKYAVQFLANTDDKNPLSQSVLTINSYTNDFADTKIATAVQSLLLQPVRESWRIILKNAVNNIQQQWQQQVFTVYAGLSSKFPFNLFSDTDVSIDDLGVFLQPQKGLMSQFISTIKPFLIKDADGLQTKKWLQIGLPLSAEFLHALTSLQDLGSALFSGDQLGFAYKIYAEPTPGIKEMVFSSNGKAYSYENGPQEWQEFFWNANATNDKSYIAALVSYGINPNAITNSGPWSLLHILGQAEISSKTNNVYKATWSVKNIHQAYKITVLFRLKSPDIFQSLFLHHLIVPQSVI